MAHLHAIEIKRVTVVARKNSDNYSPEPPVYGVKDTDAFIKESFMCVDGHVRANPESQFARLFGLTDGSGWRVIDVEPVCPEHITPDDFEREEAKHPRNSICLTNMKMFAEEFDLLVECFAQDYEDTYAFTYASFSFMFGCPYQELKGADAARTDNFAGADAARTDNFAGVKLEPGVKPEPGAVKSEEPPAVFDPEVVAIHDALYDDATIEGENRAKKRALDDDHNDPPPPPKLRRSP